MTVFFSFFRSFPWGICCLLLTGFADSRFVEGMDDFPIILDLKVGEEAVIFDSPKGTIADLILSGKEKPAHYLALYHTSLDSFGWVCKPVTGQSLHCLKNRERLVITAIPSATATYTLRVRRTPV